MSINRIVQMARKYTDYDMISLHTELPDFPDGRVRLLYVMLTHQPNPPIAADRDILVLCTSLVQMGLDTHDLVDHDENGKPTDAGAMLARQLKVLAGDYFSSRFYHLLAHAGQIGMVRRIGETICELNRLKMILYTKMKQLGLSAEEYVQLGSEIRAGLFVTFSSLMGGWAGRVWPEMVRLFSRCELLLQELRRVRRSERLGGGWGFWHVLQTGSEEDRRKLSLHPEDGIIRQCLDKYAAADTLAGLLRQSAELLFGLLERLPSDKLVSELRPLFEPFLAEAGTSQASLARELG
jgi:heptaprenyl diphosphate synthase